MDEFERINTFFAPLSKRPSHNEDVTGEAFDLRDDAAAISVALDRDLVLTKDLLVEGVHFLKNDPLDQVARKLLRVNLSDLAAKGAEPYGYLLGIAWSKGPPEGRMRTFANGLKADQERYGVTLLGGDTDVTHGPLVLSLTALGTVPKGRMLTRSGAREGDVVYVTGCIGAGAAGLKLLKTASHLPGWEKDPLIARYRLPEPRVEIGPKLLDLAHSAIDISDGLAGDAAHIAETSNVSLHIRIDDIPIATGALAVLKQNDKILTGGDDYEILFTAGPDMSKAIADLAGETGIPITPIGTVRSAQSPKPGVIFEQADGGSFVLEKGGYSHF